MNAVVVAARTVVAGVVLPPCCPKALVAGADLQVPRVIGFPIRDRPAHDPMARVLRRGRENLVWLPGSPRPTPPARLVRRASAFAMPTDAVPRVGIVPIDEYEEKPIADNEVMASSAPDALHFPRESFLSRVRRACGGAEGDDGGQGDHPCCPTGPSHVHQLIRRRRPGLGSARRETSCRLGR
jgi:hypothetical protein